MMRIQRKDVPGHADWGNDGYVKLEGDFSPGSGAPSLADLKKDTKFYGGGTSWGWN